MISRKTFGLAVLTTGLGCMLGVAIAALAIARDDQNTETRQQQKNKQYSQTQQTADRQSASDETRTRRTADEQTDDRQTDARQTEAKKIHLQGKGRQASKKFNLQPGLCILEVENAGDSNFIVRLLDENGKEIDTLVNQIGPFAGEMSFNVDRARQCLLDIETNGQWTAKLSQPKPEVGQSTPTTLEGKGYKTTPFIQLDRGLVVFKMNHDGQGRFKARLVDVDGRTVAHIVNALGQFEGSKPVNIEKPGLYFLNISADGNWTIDAE